MRNVIGIISFTLSVALTLTKADSISFVSSPIEAGIVRADRTAGMQWLASRDGMPSGPMLPPSFFEKGTPSSIMPSNSTAYLFFSTLSFAANYPIQRRNATPADGRHPAINREGSTHYASSGIEEFGRRMYRVFFETRIRERKKPRPSD